MSCEYCEEHKPIMQRNSRKVVIERDMTTSGEVYVMKMLWRTPNGKWHMEWTPIKTCPMCGRELQC